MYGRNTYSFMNKRLLASNDKLLYFYIEYFIHVLSIQKKILNQQRFYDESLFSSSKVMANSKNIWKLLTKETCKQILSQVAGNERVPNIISCDNSRKRDRILFEQKKKSWIFMKYFVHHWHFCMEYFVHQWRLFFLRCFETFLCRIHKSYRLSEQEKSVKLF